jgi:hypothetical protein
MALRFFWTAVGPRRPLPYREARQKALVSFLDGLSFRYAATGSVTGASFVFVAGSMPHTSR